MRRRLAAGIAGIVMTVGLVAPVAAMEHEHEHHFCTDMDQPGASEFGRHVAEMAQQGHLGAEHNPGMHQGYSVCVVDGEE